MIEENLSLIGQDVKIISPKIQLLISHGSGDSGAYYMEINIIKKMCKGTSLGSVYLSDEHACNCT